jgi:hypothetical protein
MACLIPRSDMTEVLLGEEKVIDKSNTGKALMCEGWRGEGEGGDDEEGNATVDTQGG